MDWDKHKGSFFVDGSLRQLLVFDTDISDWQKLLDFLENNRYKISFRVNREFLSSPESAQFIFDWQLEKSRFLSVELNDLQLNCHFFAEDEIDFNLDPKQVQSKSNYLAIIEFMQAVSNLLEKPMVMTLENDPKFVLLNVEPT